MRCPGQDRRYWTEDAVFEAPCPKCDTAVEFFKDESSGRCPGCGHRFRNPRVSFDCAKWCAYAEECLGFLPERPSSPDPGQGALAGRLIRAIKDEFDTDQARIARALAVFLHARELLARQGGDPRIVLAASLLLETTTLPSTHTSDSAAQQAGQPQYTARAKQIMEDIGLDEDTIACACHLLGTYRMGGELETVEFRVVRDADTLARAATGNRSDHPDKLHDP